MSLNHRTSLALTALLFSFGSACGASSVNDSVSGPSAAPQPDQNHSGPVSSALLGPREAPRSGEAFVLQGIVTQRVPSQATVRVKLNLPPGVQLIEGSSDQRLPPTVAPRTDALRFVLRPTEIPEQDAILIVDLRGEGFGYHAEHRYRFGREEPLPSAPERDGPTPHVNGKDLGPSVRVTR